jgi:hypothetical protein
MKRLILGGVSALLLLAGASASQAAPALIRGVDHPGDAVMQKTQYLYGGRNYCWYDGGWHGPGFYWCGYAWHRGYGWGGPLGWRGWSGGPTYWRGGVWIGPRGYAHPEWGGWRGHDHDFHHHH